MESWNEKLVTVALNKSRMMSVLLISLLKRYLADADVLAFFSMFGFDFIATHSFVAKLVKRVIFEMETNEDDVTKCVISCNMCGCDNIGTCYDKNSKMVYCSKHSHDSATTIIKCELSGLASCVSCSCEPFMCYVDGVTCCFQHGSWVVATHVVFNEYLKELGCERSIKNPEGCIPFLGIKQRKVEGYSFESILKKRKTDVQFSQK